MVASGTREGSGPGAVRTVRTAQGGEFREQLVGVDEGGRTLRYSIIQGPRPVEDHLSTIRVREAGEGRCEVEWACTFRAVGVPDEEMQRIYEQVYDLGLGELKKVHEG
jgi:hypothetical protein